VYLVDTNIVSAGAQSKTESPQKLAAWMDENSADLYMSAVSIAEIDGRIARLRRLGAGRRADDLTAWLDTLLHLYSERVLPFEVRAARLAGALADRALSLGQAPGLADLVIAATAQLHSFTILTRNARHFEPLSVPFLDPFVRLPATRPPAT
jgi:predicted nucleic acid-binding protein